MWICDGIHRHKHDFCLQAQTQTQTLTYRGIVIDAATQGWSTDTGMNILKAQTWTCKGANVDVERQTQTLMCRYKQRASTRAHAIIVKFMN